jgi:predicted HicB family RNase H-like nuclease
MIQLASRIPQSLHRATRLRAIEEERPLQEWIAEALAEHLERCQRRDARLRAADG